MLSKKTTRRPSMGYCEECLEKDLKIEELKETIKGLQAKLRYRERKEEEGYFGLSAPSSRLPHKPSGSEEDRDKKGGAPCGHPGHGRPSHAEETADETICEDVGETCPVCGGVLVLKETRDRAVVEAGPTKPKKLLYRLAVRQCQSCRRTFRARPKSVLPKSLYGNQLVANAAVMHYFHGVPMGRTSEMTGVGHGSLIEILHRLGQYFSPVMGALKEAYRTSAVRHADETGWRNDGQNGYAWLFCTASLSIFLFKDTRSSSVPKGIFGEKQLDGVLVVDRYGGCNKLPVKIQYCCAHLLRDAEKLGRDCPDDEEVVRFTAALIPLLAQAMHLASQEISDEEYYRQAQELKEKIMAVCRSPAHHLGVRAMQDVFTDHEDRLFHWVVDRRVPADNNRAERDLRPTVIARKASFGSGSEAGARTRSVLMSVLHTLNKRRGEQSLESVFKEILDKIAANRDVDLVPLVLRPVADPP
jgi:transposase